MEYSHGNKFFNQGDVDLFSWGNILLKLHQHIFLILTEEGNISNNQV